MSSTPTISRTCYAIAASSLVLACALLVRGCGPVATTDTQPDPSPIPKVRFTDVTGKAGIRFVHTNGSFGKKLLPETMGSGVAFLDFNKDGKQDILFVNSCYW